MAAASTCTERVLFILPHPEPADLVPRLERKFPGIETTYIKTGTTNYGKWGEGELDKNIFKDKTILVTLSVLPPTPSDAPNLQLVHFCSSGTDHIAGHPVYADSTIPLTTCRGIHGPPICEWVIMTALVHSHRYNLLHDLQKEQRWDRQDALTQVRDMVGQRIGILGYGGIGRQVGRVAKAMGMDVLAFTANPRNTVEERRHKDYCMPGMGDPEGTIPSGWFSGLDRPSLRRFLEQDLDMIVLCLPLTGETRHLLGKEEFEILARRQAFVSNISRGAIIDQGALLEALNTGKIRGAALDVTDPEPLPTGHPLWSAPNVIITPHLSGLTGNYVDRALNVLEANLERRIRGEPLLNIVDRSRGY